MNKKENKIAEYIKSRKKEIIVTTAAIMVGLTAGYAGHKCYISKNYGDLIEVLSEFSPRCKNGKRTLIQDLVEMLNSATRSATCLLNPNGKITVADCFTDEIISSLAENHDIEPTASVSGIMLGLTKE